MIKRILLKFIFNYAKNVLMYNAMYNIVKNYSYFEEHDIKLYFHKSSLKLYHFQSVKVLIFLLSIINVGSTRER